MSPDHPDDNGALPGSFVPEAHLEEWSLNVQSFCARRSAMDLLRDIECNRFLATTSPATPNLLGMSLDSSAWRLSPERPPSAPNGAAERLKAAF